MKKFKVKVILNGAILKTTYVGYTKKELIKDLDCMVGRKNYKIHERKKIRRKNEQE